MNFISITQVGIEKQWPNFHPRCPACGSTKVDGKGSCGQKGGDIEFEMYYVDYDDARCKDCNAEFSFHFEGVIK
jgi:hypothetical protein